MRTLCVVERKVSRPSSKDFPGRPIPLQIDVFIFDRPPKAFDKEGVQGAASAVHRERRPRRQHPRREILAGERAARIGVENLGPALSERSLQSFQAAGGVGGAGEFPSQNETAVPVNHGKQVDKTMWHWHIRDVATPDLIAPNDLYAAQQVRIDPIPVNQSV
jgi:hypothetical protein